MPVLLFILANLLCLKAYSLDPSFAAKIKPLRANNSELQHDLELIEVEAVLKKKTLILGEVKDHTSSSVKINCKGDSFILDVTAPDGEKASSLYKGIRELGFLFPHPRWQISPKFADMKTKCGKTFNWKPALKFRGSHLHNLHPNEWVHGFFLNKPQIGEQIVRWLARNGQNLIDMNLVRLPLESLSKQISPAYKLARKLEIHTGVSLGLAFTQQKSYKLISILQSIIGWGADESIKEGLHKLIDGLPLSFLVLEAGTSEFTPISYDKSVSWLNLAAKLTEEKGVALFTKVHVSTNQHHEKWGNYNFLPQYTKSNVGILPHTVMFYGLLDKKTPIYGNKDFSEMRNFILQERVKRPTWYYPETSYWVAMDLDVPLLLTEYLRTRAIDYKWLHDNGVEGHLNFTTGQALAGWLMDWNLALITDMDYEFSPLIALKLLGENEKVWQAHMDFQEYWFKDQGLIAPLSAANLQDELSETDRIHDRNTMKQLSNNPTELDRELALLEQVLPLWPSWSHVKNKQLQELLHITWRRHNHAIFLRKAIKYPNKKEEYIQLAANQRTQMQATLKSLSKLPTNYPDLPLFEKHKNPTSYQFGYIYPAASGYFWEREEVQVLHSRFFPFNGNIYDVWNILF